MKEIKTKSTIKDIKVLDKAVNVAHRAKYNFIRNKMQTKDRQQTEHGSYIEYAEDKIRGSTKTITREAGHVAGRYGIRAAHVKASQLIRKKATPDKPVEKWKRKYTLANEASKQRFAQSRAKTQLLRMQKTKVKMAPAIQVNMTSSERTVMQSDRLRNKGAKEKINGKIKTAQKSIKISTRSVKTGLKTSETVAKAAQASQKTAYATRMGAKAAEATAKRALKAMVATIKGIIAAVNGLITLIAAGGWLAIAIILVLCLAGFLMSSPFGVLFSNESYDLNTLQMRDVVSQINEEFKAELQRIENDIPHNTLDLAGIGNGTDVGNWKDILAVYAVKVTYDQQNGMEVVTMDDVKERILRDIFWDMNKIDYWLETIEHTESSTTTDKDGNVIDETYTTTETILHINVTFKSHADMIAEYGFNAQQVKILNELMQDEYQQLFMQLIGN